MSVPAAVLHFVEPWKTLYSNDKTVSSLVMFAHLGGLLVGGGGAVAADRATLRNRLTSEAEQRCHLADLRKVHRIVLWGLVITFVSGLLMLAGDLETIIGLLVFWIKMALIALLLLNGLVMTRIERTVEAGIADNWGRLRAVSTTSLALWFAIVLVSTFLAAA